ncbi:MAG: hypothetical protein ACE14M_05170 [Terriglobales bacterium]
MSLKAILFDVGGTLVFPGREVKLERVESLEELVSRLAAES